MAPPEAVAAPVVPGVSPPGLVARLHDGPAVYLGDDQELRAKWASAVSVLGDPGSVGAAYIDVTDPRRPAAGAVTQTSSGSAGSASGN